LLSLESGQENAFDPLGIDGARDELRLFENNLVKVRSCLDPADPQF